MGRVVLRDVSPAEERGYHPLRWQPRQELPQLLFSYLLYAESEVCPPVKEKTDGEVYQFYIDMRTPAKTYDEFYQRIIHEGVNFVRGKVAEITDAASNPEKKASSSSRWRHPDW